MKSVESDDLNVASGVTIEEVEAAIRMTVADQYAWDAEPFDAIDGYAVSVDIYGKNAPFSVLIETREQLKEILGVDVELGSVLDARAESSRATA
ncbi:MAG TPA: hypothetical protein VIW24_16025 [Aldersonia sp.]